MRTLLVAMVLVLACDDVLHGQEIRRALPVQTPPLPNPEAPFQTGGPAASDGIAHEIRRAEPVPSRADDDLAKFLVGIRLASDSPWAPLQESAEYGEHSSSLAGLWRHFNETHFIPMRLWSEITLATRIEPTRPLLYFFGGPDAIHAMALFPEASHYLLCGLEPVGEVAEPTGLSQQELAQALGRLRQALDVVLSYGHFITKDMKSELESGAFRGTLPLLMAFVALSGGKVLDVTYLGIGKGGVPKEFGNHNAGGANDLPGVRITFVRGEGASPQTLTYVQTNVADGPLKSNPAILQWAGRFGKANSYLKAASYLMHEPGFSRIGSFLLDHSEAILQDDSGLPLGKFPSDTWQLEFFGTYSGTLEIFQKYYQSDLRERFLTQPASPLPFGTGYKWRKGESNLMLALRRPTPPT